MYTLGQFAGLVYYWEERFYTPPPLGSDFRDCKCARIETTTSIHHPIWVVVVVYCIGLPNYTMPVLHALRFAMRRVDLSRAR